MEPKDINARCREFVRWALTDGSWSGHDIDGGVIQDMALELGLIRKEPYDIEKHGENEHCPEKGEEWFVFVDELKD